MKENMYLVLTNAADGHVGNKVAIKKDLVLVVHNNNEEQDGIITNKTYVFCPPHGTWEVSETFQQIIEQLID